MSDQQSLVSQPDVVLVGAGIMSMTLAVLLMEPIIRRFKV